jgi:hypothetical protein
MTTVLREVKTGDIWYYTIRNSDEEYEGRVEITCTPRNIMVDRYYLQEWHQSHCSFDPKKFDAWKSYAQDTRCAGVLTRYVGMHEAPYPYRTTTAEPPVVMCPLFIIDEPMTDSLATIVKSYLQHIRMKHILLIQRYIRGYLARKRFSKPRMLLLNELCALPPGHIVPWFEGGCTYREACERFYRVV